MSKQSMLSKTVLLLCPIFFLFSLLANTGGGSAAAPALALSIQGGTSNCGATTDAEIVPAVQEKIKADTRFNDQWKHINVNSKDRVVTLSGWAKGRAQVNDLIKFARTTKCVKKVVSKLKTHLTVGCGPGQKQCGDTCIDRNEECNLISGDD